MVNKYNITVGMNDRETHREERTAEQAFNIVEELLDKHNFDGSTIRGMNRGRYLKERERSFDVELLTSKNDKDVEEYLKELLQVLNQESVIVEKNNKNFVFFDGSEHLKDMFFKSMFKNIFWRS